MLNFHGKRPRLSGQGGKRASCPAGRQLRQQSGDVTQCGSRRCGFSGDAQAACESMKAVVEAMPRTGSSTASRLSLRGNSTALIGFVDGRRVPLRHGTASGAIGLSPRIIGPWASTAARRGDRERSNGPDLYRPPSATTTPLTTDASTHAAISAGRLGRFPAVMTQIARPRRGPKVVLQRESPGDRAVGEIARACHAPVTGARRAGADHVDLEQRARDSRLRTRPIVDGRRRVAEAAVRWSRRGAVAPAPREGSRNRVGVEPSETTTCTLGRRWRCRGDARGISSRTTRRRGMARYSSRSMRAGAHA